MKALVTGASGLIGSNLVSELVEHGYQVRALVRPTSDCSSLQGLECELVEGDVLDPQSLMRAASGCDVVFHTAAIFAYWGHSEEALERVAVEGTKSVVQACHAVGSRRVVLTSSSVVCGSSSSTRFRTEEDGIENDDAPVYDRVKALQERIAFELGEGLGLEVASVCPTMTVGGPDKRLVPSNALIVRYLEDPLKLSYMGGCNVVSVKDVAIAHRLVAEKGTAGHRYLVGADNLEWSLLYRHISELTGVSAPSRPVSNTTAYLLATGHELLARVRGSTPFANRAQASALGRFYWYDSTKIRRLGLQPRSTRRALAEAIGWLVTSPLVSNEIRRRLLLADEVYHAREGSKSHEVIRHGPI